MFTIAGLYCERKQEDTCPLSWWGHPICGPCNCPTEKGFDPSCNKTTGECVCKVGTVFALKVPFLSWVRVLYITLTWYCYSLADVISCFVITRRITSDPRIATHVMPVSVTRSGLTGDRAIPSPVSVRAGTVWSAEGAMPVQASSPKLLWEVVKVREYLNSAAST